MIAGDALRRWRNGAARAFLGLLAAASVAAAADDSRTVAGTAVAKVTYVTSSTVYVDRGTEAGLTRGAAVDFVRDGRIIATLTVAAASSRRASFDRTGDDSDLRAGDTARFRAAAVPPAGAADPPAPSAREQTASRRSLRAGNWLRRQGMRGRIGLRYLQVTDRTGFGGTFHQPALDVRMDGAPPSAPSLRVSVDARSRRTYRSGNGDSSSDGRARVYRLLGEWSFSPRLRAVAGRQYARGLSSVGIFDGMTLEYERLRWTFGAFSGTQPDASSFGPSADVWEHGTYVSWRDRAAGRSRWHLTAGAVGSYESGDINRENLALQVRYVGDRLFASALQDIDINRGWKRDAGEPAVSATSSFVSFRYRVNARTSVDGGIDSRRSVRLYRNRITPETEFDDRARQGYWGGVDLRPAPAVRLGIRARRTTGGAASGARSVTATARTAVPLRAGLNATWRTTSYRNGAASGWLHAATGSATLGRTRVELTGGVRRETPDAPVTADNLRWWAVDADTRLSRAWTAVLSFESSRGDLEESDQLYLNAVYRF